MSTRVDKGSAEAEPLSLSLSPSPSHGGGLFQVVYYPGRDSDTRAVTVTPPPSQGGTAVLVATRNVALGHGE